MSFNSNSPITQQEEDALLVLCTMFEKIEISKILEILRSNNCNIDKSIDDLLSVPEEVTPQETQTEIIGVNEPAEVLEQIPEELEQPEEEQFVIISNSPSPQSSPVISPSASLTYVPQEPLFKLEESIDETTPLIPSQPHLPLHKSPQLEKKSKKTTFAPSLLTDPLTKQEKILAKKKKIEEKLQRRANKLVVKKQKQQARDSKKKTTFQVDDALLPTPSIPIPCKGRLSPILEVPTPTPVAVPTPVPAPEPVIMPRSASLTRTDALELRVAQLERENAQLLAENAHLRSENTRVEEEKRAGMKWIIGQMEGVKVQVQAKDEKLVMLEAEVQKLQSMLAESKQHENKLEKLLIHSKEVLVEGVQTLSKNVSDAGEKGWAKVQVGYLEKEAEFLDKMRDLHILDKMREFAQSLKEEIQNLFKEKFAKNPKVIQTQPIPEAEDDAETEETTESDGEVTDDDAGLNDQEREELHRAKMESLNSYVQTE